MRLHRRFTQATLPVLAASALLVPLAPAQAADPAPAPRDSRPAAARALERALDALTGALPAGDKAEHGRADATLALIELRKQLPFLDRADRQRAAAVFARPSVIEDWDSDEPGVQDPDDPFNWTAAGRANEAISCTDPISGEPTPYCVHWVPASLAYVDPAEATTTQVNTVFSALSRTWDVEVDTLGYTAPPGDDFEPDGKPETPDEDPGAVDGVGAEGQIDVYLADTLTEDGGAFGYAVPEFFSDDSGARASGYLVLDGDMAEEATTGTTAEELVQVTTAHELFHLVQFGYDFLEHPWFIESTAAWMEEQVYDNVDDNRGYIDSSSLVYTQMPLDSFNGSSEYGSWVFHELYTHMLRNDVIVREAWENAAKGKPVDFDNQSSIDARTNFRWALDRALALHGWNLARAFSSFGGSSIDPAATSTGGAVYYPEGSAYPSAKLTSSYWMSTSRRAIDWRYLNLDHWGGLVVDFKPNSSLSGAWKLGVRINNPSTQSSAYATVFYADGTPPRRMSLVLNSSGDASFTVPFGYGKVKRVAIYQGNTAPSDNRRFEFRASTFK